MLSNLLPTWLKQIKSDHLTAAGLASIYAASQALTAHQESTRPRREFAVPLHDPIRFAQGYDQHSPPAPSINLEKFAGFGEDRPWMRRLVKKAAKPNYSRVFHPSGIHPSVLQKDLTQVANLSLGDITKDTERLIAIINRSIDSAKSGNVAKSDLQVTGIPLGKNIVLLVGNIDGDYGSSPLVNIRIYQRLSSMHPFQETGLFSLQAPWDINPKSGNYKSAEEAADWIRTQVVPYLASHNPKVAQNPLFVEPKTLADGHYAPLPLSAGLSFDLHGNKIGEESSSARLKARMFENFIRTIEFASGNLFNKREQ